LLLSFIIPTNKSANLITDNLKSYINCIEDNIDFSYEIIVVFNNQINNQKNKKTKYLLVQKNNLIKSLSKKILAFTIQSKLGPGPARNFGLKKSSGDYIWFLDDDDELDGLKVKKVFQEIQQNNKLKVKNDIYIHSLRNNDYKECNLNHTKEKLLKRIITHKENQEVFNFIFKKSFLLNNKLLFRSGLHEDIFFSIKSLALVKNFKFIFDKIYLKKYLKNSITGSYYSRNINDHLNNAFEILKFIKKNEFVKKFQISNNFILATIGVILYQSQKKITFKFLLNYLVNFIKKDSKNIFKSYTGPLDPKSNLTNFEYASLFFIKNINILSKYNLEKEIKNIFNSKLSCKDLNSSIFLAPDEIRACCKRFFYNGKQKGDVVLLKAKKEINLEDINIKKDELIKRINMNEAEECEGCPYIERYENKLLTKKISYISLENFSYCNMRCTYCSPKYYGGTEAIYNASQIIEELSKNQFMEDNCHVVWGGGEPTLSPKFNSITDTLLSDNKVSKLRVLTNSLRYSNKLSDVIKNEKVQIVTSVDAGTQKQFKEIRGKGEIETVLNNLKKYADSADDNKRIIIKYIFMENNFDTEELKNFIEKIVNFDLINSIFHISCDFRMEVIPERIIQAIYELGSRLLNVGANLVFLDDLIRDRIILNKIIAKSVLEYLKKIKVDDKNILSYRDGNTKKVILWGNGRQSEWFIKKTSFGNSNGILFNIAHEKQLTKNFNLDENIKIIPAGVQSIYEIQKNILNSILKKHFSSSLII
jgi:organic radical activating enzyme/glycosyltransferase involved in cell wall biosynthesis